MTEPVVIAEVVRNQRQIAAMVFKTGTIDIGNGKGLKFIPKSNGFVKIQILESGINSKVDNQSFIKTETKKAVKKSPALLKVDESVTVRNAFGDL